METHRDGKIGIKKEKLKKINFIMAFFDFEESHALEWLVEAEKYYKKNITNVINDKLLTKKNIIEKETKKIENEIVIVADYIRLMELLA